MGPSLSDVCFLCVFFRGGRFPVEPWTRLHCSELYWRCPVVLPAVQSGAPECSKACPHGFVVRIFCIALAYSPLNGRVALSGRYRCLPVHPVLSAELAGTMTPSDSLSEYLVLAHRTTSSLIVLVHKTYSNANATFVYLPAVSYWKCSRAHGIVETSVSVMAVLSRSGLCLFTHGLRVLGTIT